MDKTLKKIIAALHLFVPRQDCGDLIWEFYLPHRSRWQYLRVTKYNGIYYFSGSDWDSFSTEKECEFDLKTQTFFDALPSLLRQVHKEVRQDSVAYHCHLNRSVSVHLRQGIIPRSFVRDLIPEYLRYDLELKASEIKKMVALLSGYPETKLDSMTARKYFDYCRVAYLANGRKSHPELDLGQSGFALYDRWADHRDGGLKKIDPDSAEDFERWYNDKERMGCHPWEIYRGGNSTHIDMAVVQDDSDKKWKVLLSAFSSTRLAETCRIALALHEAKLPFELGDAKSYLLRLTGNDWVGILPRHHGIAYGWHDFPKEWHVADCIHFSWFKDDSGKSIRPLRTIRGLVTWFPLPILKVGISSTR